MQTILFVDHSAAIGGAEQSLLMLLERLDRTQWQPFLACGGGALAQRVESLAVPSHSVEMPSLRQPLGLLCGWPLAVWRLVRYARRIKADLIYANSARGALYAGPAARFAGVPFIWHMRDFSFVEPASPAARMDAFLKPLVSACAIQVVANSQAVAKQLPRSEQVEVVHNGINIGLFQPPPDRGVCRRELGLPPSVPTVGMAGRLRPWKGQERFLRVAAQIRRVLPEAHFVVAGGDPFAVEDGYVEHLPRLAHALGLQDRVLFTGHVNDLRPMLAAMDVFVHPGEPEPFGLVNIEAMAMGCPVVAFAHGALPEIVEDGRTGLLVKPGDEAEMVRVLIGLLRDPVHRTRMGLESRRRAEGMFAIERTVEAINDLLNQVLDRQIHRAN